MTDNQDVSDFIEGACSRLVACLIALNTLATEYEAITGRKITETDRNEKRKQDQKRIDRIYWKG